MAKAKASAKTYPLTAARRLALHAQGLDAAPSGAPTPDSIYNMITRILCLQIDTLQLVQRSQYLVMWSRLGAYDPAMLDQVAFGDRSKPAEKRERRLFEYWLKEACLIPLTEYRYVLHRMRWFRDVWAPRDGGWLSEQENRAVVEVVLDRIRQEGGMRSAQFEHKRNEPGGWWNWKPAKRALEHLYNVGDLMIADRINFQRVYDLRERVLPAWVKVDEPSKEESHRYLLTRAIRSLGIANPSQVAPYVRLSRTEAKSIIEGLIKKKVVVQVQAEQADGKTRDMIVHRDLAPLLDQAADGALSATHTTFLSPFDNLFWSPERDMALWNFKHRMEMYTPEPLRKWGYFSLPILHDERLVGRLDPKLERKTGLMRIKALHLEPDVKPDEALIAGVAGAMRDFMRFHEAKTLEIEKSDPKPLATKLMKAM